MTHGNMKFCVAGLWGGGWDREESRAELHVRSVTWEDLARRCQRVLGGRQGARPESLLCLFVLVDVASFVKR